MSSDASGEWGEIVELMRKDVRVLGRDPLSSARFLRRFIVSQDALNAQFRRAWSINSHEMHAVLTLWEFGRMTMTELGRRIPLSRAAVTTLTDRLEALALVKRVPDPTDRRRILLEITEVVERELERIMGGWDARVQEYVQQLDPEVWGTVVDVLADLRQMARDEADAMRMLDTNALRQLGDDAGSDPRTLHEPSRPTWW